MHLVLIILFILSLVLLGMTKYTKSGKIKTFMCASSCPVCSKPVAAPTAATKM